MKPAARLELNHKYLFKTRDIILNKKTYCLRELIRQMQSSSKEHFMIIVLIMSNLIRLKGRKKHNFIPNYQPINQNRHHEKKKRKIQTFETSIDENFPFSYTEKEKGRD